MCVCGCVCVCVLFCVCVCVSQHVCQSVCLSVCVCMCLTVTLSFSLLVWVSGQHTAVSHLPRYEPMSSSTIKRTGFVIIKHGVIPGIDGDTTYIGLRMTVLLSFKDKITNPPGGWERGIHKQETGSHHQSEVTWFCNGSYDVPC